MARASVRFEAIIPRKLNFAGEFLDALIEQELDAAQAGVKKDFERTVRTWKNKPDFKTEKQPGRRWVKTNHQVYYWLNTGTPPHIIRAKNGKSLVFYRTGFKPKSRPEALVSLPGQRASEDKAHVKMVHHPGTKARNWSIVIQKKWQKKLSLNLRKGMKAAAKQ